MVMESRLDIGLTSLLLFVLHQSNEGLYEITFFRDLSS